MFRPFDEATNDLMADLAERREDRELGITPAAEELSDEWFGQALEAVHAARDASHDDEREIEAEYGNSHACFHLTATRRPRTAGRLASAATTRR